MEAYGGTEEAIIEAKGSIDYAIEQKQKEKNAKLKKLIRSKVPIEYRMESFAKMAGF